MVIYKAVMSPAQEFASSILWSPLASSNSMNKLQVMQNTELRNGTGYIHDTNKHHLHDETLILPIHEHLQLHASQYKQNTKNPSHPLHKHTTYFNTPRLKNTIFNNGCNTINIPIDPHDNRHKNKHAPYTYIYIVSRHLATRGNNKILRTPPPHISISQEMLPRLTRCILAQLKGITSMTTANSSGVHTDH